MDYGPTDHSPYQTGNVLFSRAVARQVSSALESLTSVFGMGTGGTSPPLSPDPLLVFFPLLFREKIHRKAIYIFFLSSFQTNNEKSSLSPIDDLLLVKFSID